MIWSEYLEVLSCVQTQECMLLRDPVREDSLPSCEENG